MKIQCFQVLSKNFKLTRRCQPSTRRGPAHPQHHHTAHSAMGQGTHFGSHNISENTLFLHEKCCKQSEQFLKQISPISSRVPPSLPYDSKKDSVITSNCENESAI